MQSALHRTHRETERCRGLLAVEILDVAEHDDDAIRLRQEVDAAPDGRAQLPTLELTVWKYHRLDVARPMAGLVELRQEIVERLLGLPPPGPETHQRGVHDDA